MQKRKQTLIKNKKFASKVLKAAAANIKKLQNEYGRKKISNKILTNPTDYLASERTFPAWIRTGIAIMAFGIVVVKIPLFIK